MDFHRQILKVQKRGRIVNKILALILVNNELMNIYTFSQAGKISLSSRVASSIFGSNITGFCVWNSSIRFLVHPFFYIKLDYEHAIPIM